MKILFAGFYRQEGRSLDYNAHFVADRNADLAAVFKAVLQTDYDDALTDVGWHNVDIIPIISAFDYKTGKSYKVQLVPVKN